MLFNGAILAGGQSKRMGKDKALLKVKGISMLEQNKQVLQKAGAKNICISRNDGLKNHIGDQFTNSGPLAGIHAAIAHSNDDPLLIIPVDLPLLTSDTLLPLVRTGIMNRVNCQFHGQNLPLLLFQPRQFIEPLYQTLREGRALSVGKFFSQFPAKLLPCPTPYTLVNTNTPDEWTAAHLQYSIS